MHFRHLLLKPTRLALACAIAFTGASSSVNAWDSDLEYWQSAYPDSTSDENLSDECALCHIENKYNKYNSYGWAYLESKGDFSSIESINSDGDPGGATNLEEIKANTQPGWTEGAINVVLNGKGEVITSTATAVAITGGTLDPSSTTNQSPVADIGGPYSGTVNIALDF
ncbi:MAG: hypothetical protein PVI97_06415, partial [Candidatus Thiodiazotropha sp.]